MVGEQLFLTDWFVSVFHARFDGVQFNFVGRILGPRGMTAKQLEQETGCKIMVRGRGSMRDKKKVWKRRRPLSSLPHPSLPHPSLPHSLTPFNQQYCSINLPIALERAFRDRSAAPDRFQIGSWAALCHKRLIIGSLVWLLATRGSCLYSIKIDWNPWTYYNIQRIQSILSFHQHQFPIIFNSICRNEWLNCCRQDFWFNSMKRSTICHSFNSHSNKNKLIRAIFERIESPRWRAVWFQAAGDRSGPIGMLTKLNAATVSLSLVYDSPLATNERTGGAEPR